MTSLDPTPFVAVYVALVFVLPWVVGGVFVAKALMYARSRGISLFSITAPAQIRALRQIDAHADFLHRRSRRWLVITLAAWVAGFGVMCLMLYLLHQKGIV